MTKRSGLAGHSDDSTNDSAAAGLIKYILGIHGQVAARIHDYDTWPNTDGHVELLGVDRKPTGLIWTQVKKLPDGHGMKYPCPTGLFEFAEQNPILLLGVDLKAEKIYWLYYDEGSVGELEYKDKKTLTVSFDEGQLISKTDDTYPAAWKTLLKERRSRVQTLRNTIQEQLQASIDVSKQLLEKRRYTEALDHLSGLKQTQWDIAANPAKFRILANLASAQFQTGNVNDAAKNFLDAYKYDPSAPKAATNRALGYLLQDKYQEALDEVEKVVVTNPKNAQAASIKVQALNGMSKPFAGIVASVNPDIIQEPEVSHALATAAMQSDLTDETRKYFEQAVKDEDDPQALANFGTYLIDQVITNNPTALRGMLSPDQKTQVRRGFELLKRAWELVPDKRDCTPRSEWLYNQIVACRLLGDDDCETEKSSEELLSLKPEDDFYVKSAAVVAMESGKPQLAETFVRKRLDSGSKMPELRLLLADALLAQNDLEKAEAETLAYLKDNKTHDDLWVNATQNLYEIYLQQKKLDQVDKLAEGLVQDSDTRALGLLLKAKLANVKQDSEGALSAIREAGITVSAKTERKTILDIADEAYRSGAYDTAANMYGLLTQTNVDSPLTRRYVHSLFESGRYDKVISAAKEIREAVGISRGITQFEWGAYQELQNLPAAKKLLTEYVKQNPDDESARLSIALIDTRQGNTKELDAYLASTIDLEQLDFHSRIQLANLYEMRKQTKKVLDLLYVTRKKFENDADAHSAYVSLVLGLEDAAPELEDPKEVGPNSVLLYDGGYFIVEADREPSISDNEISVEDATKRGFIGKKIGDNITLAQNRLAGAKEAKITLIKSKYVFALQESMQNYERRFPHRTDLMGFSVEDAADFGPLFKQLDQTREHADQVETLYREGKITIDLFAKLVNKDLIEVFYALRGTPNLGVKVADGTPNETGAVEQVLNDPKRKRLVADITALITFFETGLTPSEVGIDKLVVAQTTVDLITQQLQKERTYGKKQRMTLYKENGKYIRQEITEVQQAQRLKHLEDLADWVKKNTQTRPLRQAQTEKIEKKSETPEKLKDIISTSQLDTIKLALEPGAVLYCDDFGLRMLSGGTFGTKGVWTQALILHQHQAGKITKEQYERITIGLANASYYYVGISRDTLIEAARQAKYLPGPPFDRVLLTMTRPETTIESMTGVLLNFIHDLYTEKTLADRSQLTRQVLTEATRHHDAKQFLQLFVGELGKMFALSPVQLKEIEKTIEEWRQLRGY